MPRFGDGVYTVVPTPFDDEGSLDLTSLGRLTEFLVGLGVDGLLILGVMGEAPKLVGPERNQVIDVVLERAGGAPVIVGTSHPSARGANEFSRVAQDRGAAGVMIAPPRLARDDREETLRYFERAVEGLDVDVVLQDHPTSTGVLIDNEAIVELVRRVPAVRHVKLEDSPTARKVAQLRAMAGKDLKIFGGLGGVFFLEEMRAGANGTMTGFAFPEILRRIYRSFVDGDDAGASEVFYRHLPLIRFEFQDEVGLAVRKRVYKRRGAIAHDTVRAPGVALDDETARGLETLLRWLDLVG